MKVPLQCHGHIQEVIQSNITNNQIVKVKKFYKTLSNDWLVKYERKPGLQIMLDCLRIGEVLHFQICVESWNDGTKQISTYNRKDTKKIRWHLK